MRLRRAQDNYALFQASDEQWVDRVRPARDDELRRADWTPSGPADLSSQLWRDRDEILLLLNNAFAGVSRAGGVSLRQSRVLDDWGVDVEGVLSEPEPDVVWQDVPADDLARFDSALCFLDPIGIRYYLPAYIAWDLSQCRGVGALDFCSHLLFQLGYARDPHRTNFELLNPQQCHVVYRYLQFIQDYGCEYTAGDAAKAIASFWGDWA